MPIRPKTSHWLKGFDVTESVKRYLPEFSFSPTGLAPKDHPWGNWLLDIGMGLPGSGRSLIISVIGKFWKLNQPFSAALLQHYVGGSGEPFDLNKFRDIPEEWQKWIVKWTKAAPGKYSMDPYNMQPFIPDLKNSLGHFNVTVEQKTGSVNIYHIAKESYHFGFRENDKDKRGQHGFEVPLRSDEIEKLKNVLPTRTYMNPGGFREKFELKKVHGKWILYVPYEVATNAGKPFKVYGSFER